MMRSSMLVILGLAFAVAHARAADATSPVDPAQRNTTYATGAAVEPDKRRPQIDESLQQKRVTPLVNDKTPAVIGERRASIDLTETREKVIAEKQIRTPEVREVTKSQFDQQRSRYSTSGDTTKPPMVAKYQDSLSAASAANMSRFPALSGATKAKINRFIFRKNGAELAGSPQAASVVPAAGGAAPTR